MPDYVPGLVSIIITTCKREMPVLECALSSAEGQTYTDCEIIIVNDFPEYEGKIRELLKDHKKVIFISNASQSGACISRNRGAAAAKGEYIAFLDDDDKWYRNKIEMQMNEAQADTGLVYCDYEAVMDGKTLKKDADRAFPEGDVLQELLAGNFIGGCSIPLIKHKVFDECGKFDSAFRSCQDIDLWIRIAEHTRVCCSKIILSEYSVGSVSITGSFERRMQGWNAVLEKYNEEYSRYPGSYKKFTGTMVREAAKRTSFHSAWKLAVKYGRYHDMISGTLQKILRIY